MTTHYDSVPSSDNLEELLIQNDSDSNLDKVLKIRKQPLFNNQHIKNKSGQVLNQTEWEHWIQAGILTIDNLYNHDGDITNDIEFRLRKAGDHADKLEILCAAIPLPWRELLWDTKIPLEDHSHGHSHTHGHGHSHSHKSRVQSGPSH
jgi:ABC-type nickel/cobalt efflux system permease component RcnA